MVVDSALPPAPQFILHPRPSLKTLARVGTGKKSRLSTGSRMSYGMTPLGSSLPSSFISENGSFVIEGNPSPVVMGTNQSLITPGRNRSGIHEESIRLSQGCAVLDESQESKFSASQSSQFSSPSMVAAGDEEDEELRRSRIRRYAFETQSFLGPPLLDDGRDKDDHRKSFTSHGARDSIGTYEDSQCPSLRDESLALDERGVYMSEILEKMAVRMVQKTSCEGARKVDMGVATPFVMRIINGEEI